ncbi:MAG: diacylglycerol kinase [bacterium]
MAKPGNTGLTRIIKAAGYSIQGFRAAWRNESAFRQEVVLAAFMAPIAWWLSQSAVELAILLSTLLLVIIVELINSAIEAVVDRIGPDPHTLSGRAKDLGSAAVLLSIVLLLAVWGAIAIERFHPEWLNSL